MGYTLGTFVPLVGGGYATASQRSGTVEGYPSIELFVQLYDANKQPIGGPVVVGKAFSNPISGHFATFTGYDLVAAPFGGFDVVYTGSSSQGMGSPTWSIQAGAIFDARGQIITAFNYDYAVAIPVPPRLIPLLNGGWIVQQDWSFWVYDAQGKVLSQTANSGGELRDLVTAVAQTTTRSDGTLDQWLFRIDATGIAMVGTAIVKTLAGTTGDDVLVGSVGPDVITGGAGDDALTGGFGFDTLSGGAGADRFTFGLDGSVDRVTDFDSATDTLRITDLQGGALPASPSGVITFDARSHVLYWDDDGAAGPHQPAVVAVLDGVSQIGLANILGVQPAMLVNIMGLGSYDVIGSGVLAGGSAADKLTGGDDADTLSGGGGDDILTGGGGSDVIDGGAGSDTAVYAGASTSFRITVNSAGWKVSDLRTGHTTDVDTLKDIEKLTFQDKVLTLGSLSLDLAVANVLRAQPGEASAQTLIVDLYPKIASGQMGSAALGGALAKAAIATTSVATLSYQFFTGKTPGEGGMDYLVAASGPNANNLNSAYYQSFNLENRYINFAVNLGKLGEGAAKFSTDYGALSLFEATRKAYGAIFGATPTDEKVHALIDTRTAYFEAYGHDGPSGVGTKAAMVGWLLAEAAKADVGVYALSNDAFLTDVVVHNAAFGVDLVGVYSQPSFVLH